MTHQCTDKYRMILARFRYLYNAVVALGCLKLTVVYSYTIILTFKRRLLLLTGTMNVSNVSANINIEFSNDRCLSTELIKKIIISFVIRFIIFINKGKCEFEFK